MHEASYLAGGWSKCHAASTDLTVTVGLHHNVLQLLRIFYQNNRLMFYRTYNPPCQPSWNYINFCTGPVTQREKVSSWCFYKSVYQMLTCRSKAHFFIVESCVIAVESMTQCNLISKFIFAQISVYAVRNNVIRPILNNNSVNRTSDSV